MKFYDLTGLTGLGFIVAGFYLRYGLSPALFATGGSLIIVALLMAKGGKR